MQQGSYRRKSVSGSSSSGSSGRLDSSPIQTTRQPPGEYYDYTENDAQYNPRSPTTANSGMAMQVPIPPPGQQRIVENGGRPPVTTAQIAAASAASQRANANLSGGGRSSRPPSYSGPPAGPRPEDVGPAPLNKVDLDAARYNRQARRQQAAKQQHSPNVNGRPQSSGMPPGTRGVLDSPHARGPEPQARPMSPGSPLLAPGALIQRVATPSVTSSVLQPLDAKVQEYGGLMNEAQDEMARLEDEMRQLQDRQREAEGRFLDAKSKHDEYRRQYHDVERALRGEPPVGQIQQMPRDGGMNHGGQGGQQGGRDGGPPGMLRMSQRTVSMQSDKPSMMSQDSVRTQKKGRFRMSLFG